MTSLPPAGKDYSFLLQQPEKLKALLDAYKPTPHPVFRLPSNEELVAILKRPDGRAVLEKGLAERETKIAQMKSDPFHYGYSPECWLEADRLLESHTVLHVSSRNRNTKTQKGAQKAMSVLMRGNTRVWCLCQNNETSIRGGGQQEVVFDYMPPEVKAAALNKNRKAKTEFGITYSVTNRFTNNAFHMPTPNGPSECRFMNYEQDIDIIEGGDIDFFWADELIPVEWVNTLLYRLIDRKGKGLITFTPVKGWNETYAMIYEGCEVVQWQPFPHLGDLVHWTGGQKGMIPYIVQPTNPRFAGMFFPPDSNPWVPFADVADTCAAASYEQKLIRLAGIARRAGGAQFPKFGKAHIIPARAVPQEGTNFHFVDFAWARNWANLWVRVRRIKDRVQFYVYRDWPDKPTYGDWAEHSSKPGGKRGPAQEKVVTGVDEYVQLIRKLEGGTAEAQRRREGGENQNGEIPSESPSASLRLGGQSSPEIICQRFGDPRSGAAQAISQEENDGGLNFFTMLNRAGLEVSPVALLSEERFIGEGIKLINDLLNYDLDQYRADGNRFSPLNTPQLLISEECEQVIECLGLWTPHGPVKDQACKDFIDLLRYMAVSELDDWGNHPVECVGGGSY